MRKLLGVLAACAAIVLAACEFPTEYQATVLVCVVDNDTISLTVDPGTTIVCADWDDTLHF